MKTNSLETVMVKCEVELAAAGQMAFANVALTPGTNKGWDVLSVYAFVDNDTAASANTSVGAVVRRTKTTPGSDIEDAVTQDTVSLGSIMDATQSGSTVGTRVGGMLPVLADNVVLNNLQFVVATVNGEAVVDAVRVFFVVELIPVDVPQSRLIGVLTEQP